MLRATNRRRLPHSGSAGFTLVELIVAMLISCTMITAVMGVAVTSKQGGGKAMRHTLFNQGIAQLSAEIKQYVTACGCTKAAGSTCPAPQCTTILGPNINVGGVNTWNINGAAGAIVGIPITDAAVYGGGGRATWALSCGNHVLTGVMNGSTPSLEAPPYNGSITYNVSYPSGCAGLPLSTDVPEITYTANWTEPP
jgi:prepilin-type N-terminal cleavage/methylation domain-containing protein